METPDPLLNPFFSNYFPIIIYGTAWKEEATAHLVTQALECGFRAIDTANQRKHYFEAGVGEGLSQFYERSSLSREDLFLQTKFTYARGQDHRKPYDEYDSYTDQVQQSFESSLEHLKTDYIDSYILHGPFNQSVLSAEDWETWEAMEDLYDEGLVRHLGVSNFSALQLALLCEKSKVNPQFVQNRCFASLGWDRDVRLVAQQNDVVYQGFSLLTANVKEFKNPLIVHIIEKLMRPLPEIIFNFSRRLGMIPLTGTTQKHHMEEDLKFLNIELTDDEVFQLEHLILK